MAAIQKILSTLKDTKPSSKIKNKKNRGRESKKAFPVRSRGTAHLCFHDLEGDLISNPKGIYRSVEI